MIETPAYLRSRLPMHVQPLLEVTRLINNVLQYHRGQAMANAPHRSSLRARAIVIGGITLSIFVGVAVLGWFAGWRTVDQYSTALYIAGAGAAALGVISLAGNQTRGAQGQFGAASLEIAYQQTRGQSDYFQDVNQSFAFLVMMSVVGLLVAGAGFALQALFG